MSEYALVIDDDPTDASFAAEILRSRGIEVAMIGGGDGALVAIERRRPDIVVLGTGGGQNGGHDVLERIKASPQQAAIPVILATAEASDEDMLTGYRFGADYFLAKPYTPRQLLHGVGLVLGRELIG